MLKYILFFVGIACVLNACSSALPTPESATCWTPHHDTERAVDFSTQSMPVKFTPSRVGADFVKMRATLTLDNTGNEARPTLIQAKIMNAEGTRQLADAQTAINLLPGNNQTVDLEFNTIYVPPLWSPDTPKLLPVEIKLLFPHNDVVNTYKTQIGLRWFVMNEKQGFRLNGLSTPIRGVAWGCTTDTAPLSPKAIAQRVSDIKNLGANAIFFTTLPDDYTLLLCDHIGLMAFANTNATTSYKISRVKSKDAVDSANTIINHPALIAIGGGYDGDALDNIQVTETIRTLRKTFPAHLSFAGIRDDAQLMREGHFALYALSTDQPDTDLIKLQQLQHEGIPMPILVWLQPTDSSPAAFLSAFKKLDKLSPTPAGVIIASMQDKDAEFDYGLKAPASAAARDLYYFIAARWTRNPILKIEESPSPDPENPNTYLVHIFSNLKTVELFVNNESCGSAVRPFGAWKIPLLRGDNTITAKGHDENGDAFSDELTISLP